MQGKRALVISGGGSKGAWAGGFSHYLRTVQGMSWDIYIGSSTGSLLVPMIAINAWQPLKKAYTTSQQNDIFSNCPFTVLKTPDGYKTTFNHFRILLQFAQGRKTMGESKSLRTLIKKSFTEEMYEKARVSGAEIVVTVSNLTHENIEYKYLGDYSYEEFCDWIWISCNLVPLMSLVKKDGCEYADAGFGNPIPIQEAVNLGAGEIDVIVLQPRHRSIPTIHATNPFLLMLKTINFMQNQLAQDDIHIGMTEARLMGTKVRIIHTPEELTTNSFIFDPEPMSRWWQQGYDHAAKLVSERFWDQ